MDKTIGQIAYEAHGCLNWDGQFEAVRQEYERTAAAVVDEHERRSGTAEMVAKCEAAVLQVGIWDLLSQREKTLLKDAIAAIGAWKEANRG